MHSGPRITKKKVKKKKKKNSSMHSCMLECNCEKLDSSKKKKKKETRLQHAQCEDNGLLPGTFRIATLIKISNLWI